MTTADASKTTRRTSRRAIPVSIRTYLIIGLATISGLMMFMWPLLVTPDGLGGAVGQASQVSDAPLAFGLILVVLISVSAADLHSGSIDTKALAMLGVLAAIGAVLRPMGAGLAGIETVFFLLVLAGRVYGPGFGFVLGSTTLFASALLTGGVGPWLPFQMMCASWIGMGAGFLPKAKGKLEITMLVVYGIFAAYAFGFLMNIWFWPYAVGIGTDVSFVAGAPVFENLQRFFVYTVASSTLGWDTGRAITNSIALILLGPTILEVLRRANRKAVFDRSVVFKGSDSELSDRQLGIEARSTAE